MSSATQSVRGRRARACSSSRWPRSSGGSGGTRMTLRPVASASARPGPGRGGRAPARDRTRRGRSSAAPSAAAPASTSCAGGEPSATKSETAITRWPRGPRPAGRRLTRASCTVVTSGTPAARAACGAARRRQLVRGRGSGDARAPDRLRPAAGVAPAGASGLRVERQRQMGGAGRGQLALQRAASRARPGTASRARAGGGRGRPCPGRSRQRSSWGASCNTAAVKRASSRPARIGCLPRSRGRPSLPAYILQAARGKLRSRTSRASMQIGPGETQPKGASATGHVPSDVGQDAHCRVSHRLPFRHDRGDTLQLDARRGSEWRPCGRGRPEVALVGQFGPS